MKNVKKISSLSAIMIIIGSTVGAGIFFKNHELFKQAQGNLMLVLASWIVAGVGMIALGLAVIEMSTASKTNKGILEWFKNFMPKWMEKSSKNYVQLIFIPITLFTMPLYVVSTWKDAGLDVSGAITLLIGFAVFVWIAGISFISLKASVRAQWVLTAIKFIPVVIVPIFALINAGNVGDAMHHPVSAIGKKEGLLGIAPAIVLIGGIPAISFAFDGFYETTSLRNDLKNPKKMGPIIALGVSIILAIYIAMTIAFGLGAEDGSVNGVTTNKELLQAFNVMIGIGIVGIVNGYMMVSVEQSSALYEEGEAPILTGLDRVMRKVFKRKLSTRTLSWTYVTMATIMFFIILGPIGIYAWSAKAGSTGSENLYAFADVLVNYTSVLTFGLISISIIGAMINRRTKKIKVEKKKYFLWTAILSSIIILGGVIFQIVVGIFDASGFRTSPEQVTNAIITLSVFVGMITISVTLGLIEHFKWDSNKHEKLQKDTELESVAG